MNEIINIIIGGFNSAYIETILFPSKLLEKKEYFNIRSFIIILLFLPVLHYADYIVMPYRLAVIIMLYSIMIKLMYKKDMRISLLVSIYSYSMGFLSDAFNVLMYLNIFKIDLTYILEHEYLQYVMYFSFLLISIIISYIIRPRELFCETEEFLLNKDSKTVTKYIVMILTFMSILGYLAVTQPYLSPQHIASVLSLIMFIVINDMYIRQIKMTAKTKNDLDEIYYYATKLEKTENMLRKKEHEYKNQLITINLLAENQEYNKVREYIEELLENDLKMEDTTDSNFEMINDVLLKQLLIYKSNRASEMGIKVESMVMREIDNIGLSIKELSYIINIVMDNAIEASSISERKILCILIDSDETKISIIVSNTYESSDINENLYEQGSSTKGKERGNGLAILQEIEENNPNVRINTMPEKDMFIQEIEIITKNMDSL